MKHGAAGKASKDIEILLLKSSLMEFVDKITELKVTSIIT